MTQQSNRACPKCDTPLTPGQRFCSNCGSIVEPSAYQPTELTPNSGGSLPEMGTYLETPPPPPPSNTYSPQSSMPPQMNYQPPQDNYQPPQMGYQPPPSYAAAPKDSSKKVLGQIGCGMLAIIVLAVALCGGVGFFAFSVLSAKTSNVSHTTSSTSGNSTNDVTPTLAPPTVSPVNATIKFADVDMTIVDVKVAGGFPDETSSSSSSTIVRIDLKENNKTARSSSYYYGDVMRLIMSDGTSVTPFNAQYSSGPDAAVSRTNWVDFPGSANMDVNKMTFQLGKVDQAVIAVPLTNNPDVAKYQPKTVTPGKSTTYVNTNWTLVSATEQLSGDNQQAPKGQMYVIVSVKVDNNSGQSFTAYPGDYVRLQTGDTKATAESDSIPLSVAAGQTNQTGNALFLVPQGSTNFTLLLLATASTGATQQSSIAFQI